MIFIAFICAAHFILYILPPFMHLPICMYFCLFSLIFSGKIVKRRGISPHLCFFYYSHYVRFYSFLSVDFIVLSNFDCPFPSVALVLLGTRYSVLGTWHLALGTWHLALGTWHLALGTWHLALGTINFTSYFLFLISYFFLLQLCSRVLTFLSRFPLQAA